MTTLTAIVPATDRPPTLPHATAAIARADAPPDEIIVVTEPAHLSAAAARNVGACRAAGDVLVFVDADVDVHPDAFARIRTAFATDPGLTAVFGSYDDAPSHRGAVSSFRNLLHHHVHQAGSGPAETFWAGLGAVRRDAFLAVGGFDAGRYRHPSVEDIDLGARLAAAGMRLRLDPAIQGTHRKVWTLGRMVWTDFARRAVPWVGLQLRVGRVSAALNCGWRHRVSALACIGVAGSATTGRAAAALASLALLVVLNRSFYALLARRQGRRAALLGVGLHAVHHLLAVAAVPVGVALHLGGRGDRLAPPAPLVADPAPPVPLGADPAAAAAPAPLAHLAPAPRPA